MRSLRRSNMAPRMYVVSLVIRATFFPCPGGGFASPYYAMALLTILQNPQAQVFASHQTGPDGRIDQCNFLKMVDEPSPPVVSMEGSSPGSGVNNTQNASSTMPSTTRQTSGFQSYGELFENRHNNGFHDGRGADMVVFPGSSGSDLAGSRVGGQSTYGLQRYVRTVPEIDLDMSSGDANDHRTPSSTAPSDGRGGNGNGGALAPHKPSVGSNHGLSERSSYETSPIPHQISATTLQQQQQMVDRQAASLEQQVSATFYTSGGTGEYMNSTQGFSMGQRQHGAFGGQNVNGWAQQEGLTPIGEGVFRELMGIGGAGGFGGVWDPPS